MNSLGPVNPRYEANDQSNDNHYGNRSCNSNNDVSEEIVVIIIISISVSITLSRWSGSTYVTRRSWWTSLSR